MQIVNFVVGTPAMEHPNYDSMNAFIKTLFLFVHMKFDNLVKTDNLFPAFLHKEAIINYIHKSVRFYQFLHLIVSASYFPKFLFFQFLAKHFRT